MEYYQIIKSKKGGRNLITERYDILGKEFIYIKDLKYYVYAIRKQKNTGYFRVFFIREGHDWPVNVMCFRAYQDKYNKFNVMTSNGQIRRYKRAYIETIISSLKWDTSY